jgi:hypothetical protein
MLHRAFRDDIGIQHEQLQKKLSFDLLFLLMASKICNYLLPHLTDSLPDNSVPLRLSADLNRCIPLPRCSSGEIWLPRIRALSLGRAWASELASVWGTRWASEWGTRWASEWGTGWASEWGKGLVWRWGTGSTRALELASESPKRPRSAGFAALE